MTGGERLSENNWCVYRHTFPDGKVYIGKTSGAPEKRWGNLGQGYQGQHKVFNAILAYGWNNIKHEVLFDGLSDDEADIKERELIRLSDTEGQSGNYNVTFAKHDTPKKDIADSEDAVICEESLRRNGKHLLHLPDKYFDKAVRRSGQQPFSIMLEEDGISFEFWRFADGGYEYAKNTAEYPRENMTFREVREWLVETGETGTEVVKNFISNQTVEEHMKELQKPLDARCN